MPDKGIETYIEELLTGDKQNVALTFEAFLRANGFAFERGGGYWADKWYWYVKYNNQFAGYIALNYPEGQMDSWTVWSDEYNTPSFADYPLDEETKQAAWAHIDICAHCGSCEQQGTCKRLFGRDFENVCGTTFRFDNPDADALACMQKLFLIRKEDIDR